MRDTLGYKVLRFLAPLIFWVASGILTVCLLGALYEIGAGLKAEKAFTILHIIVWTLLIMGVSGTTLLVLDKRD